MKWKSYFSKIWKFENYTDCPEIEMKLKMNAEIRLCIVINISLVIDSLYMNVGRHGRIFRNRIKRGAICGIVSRQSSASTLIIGSLRVVAVVPTKVSKLSVLFALDFSSFCAC